MSTLRFHTSVENDLCVDEPILPIMPWIEPKTLLELGEELQVLHKKVKKRQKRLDKGKLIWNDLARLKDSDSNSDIQEQLGRGLMRTENVHMLAAWYNLIPYHNSRSTLHEIEVVCRVRWEQSVDY